MKTGYLVAGLGLLLLGGPVEDMFGKGNEQIGSGVVGAASWGLLAMGFGASRNTSILLSVAGGGLAYVGRGVMLQEQEKAKT